MNPMYIGGNFEIDLSLLLRPEPVSLDDRFGLGAGYAWMNAGRHAFGTVLDRAGLAGRGVLIPEFLCEAALLPEIERRGVRFATYPLGDDLLPQRSAFERALEGGPGAVLFVNYFGLVDNRAFAATARTKAPDAAIVLDNVAAFYDLADDGAKGAWADWQIFGVRKFFPVPDGAAVKAPPGVALPALAPGNWQQPSLHVLAGCLRAAFATGAATAEAESWYLDLFERSEAALGGGPCAMSPLSRAIVERLPLDSLAARRRGNFSRLLSSLPAAGGVIPLFGSLPDGAVPLTLPVRVGGGRRDALRRALAGRGIFCPVHWPLSAAWLARTEAATSVLAGEILSLPIDQRYGDADIDRLAAAIAEEAGRG